LQRAVTSRSVVNLPEQRWRKLDRALESLAEAFNHHPASRSTQP
jgi:hypothetical protein